MTTMYFGWGTRGSYTLEKHADAGPVDILVAYPFLKQFEKVRARFNIGKLMLDSGAFSVLNSGATINLEDYIAACRDVGADEIASLDVIGDHEASRRNAEIMWDAGIPAIPVYHYGEPVEALHALAKRAPKIGLGGVARMRGNARYEWVLRAFAHVWPKKIHGFGMASWDAMKIAPFHSVDASSWVYAPKAMGHFAGLSGRQMRVYGTHGVRDLWIEVEEHQRRARWAVQRWRRELALVA